MNVFICEVTPDPPVGNFSREYFVRTCIHDYFVSACQVLVDAQQHHVTEIGYALMNCLGPTYYKPKLSNILLNKQLGNCPEQLCCSTCCFVRATIYCLL